METSTINKLTKEILISELKRYYAEHGIPTVKSFKNNPKYPSYSTYVKYFGGLENAMREAGIYEKVIVNKKEILISELKRYYDEYNEIPTARNLVGNPNYPSTKTYQNWFGSYNNALKLAELDFDSMLEKREAKLNCNHHKGRLFEMLTNKSFKTDGAIDLSGQNFTMSPFDGICPKGYTYDCKSASLRLAHKYGSSKRWTHPLRNKEITNTDYIIFGGFNEDYTKLLHVWMFPIRALCTKKNNIFYIKSGISISYSDYGLKIHKQYEITDKCLNIDKLLNKLMEEKNMRGTD